MWSLCSEVIAVRAGVCPLFSEVIAMRAGVCPPCSGTVLGSLFSEAVCSLFSEVAVVYSPLSEVTVRRTVVCSVFSFDSEMSSFLC